MIKSLVLGFSVCFHLGMFSLTSSQLFLFACISILEANKSVAIFFFFKSLFLTKDPLPPQLPTDSKAGSYRVLITYRNLHV